MKQLYEIKENPKSGKSLVALTDIPIGTPIVKFDGPKMHFCDVPEDEVCYAIWIGPEMFMIPKTDARYINHSCDPNCTINYDYDVVPFRPIKKGEEISFSYNVVRKGENPGEWDDRWSFLCACGCKNCQGKIDKYVTEDGKKFECN